MARQALGLAGGVIGAYFGGPMGAQIGFAIGSTLGGIIDPEEIQGPKLGEVPIQTGRDGVPIPWGWGIVHTSGNIIQKNPVVEIEEREKQGKGGGTTVVNVRRTRTFAIGVIRGPVKGILRIWQNDKLVYDARSFSLLPTEDQANYASQITIYLGDEDQLPDPELESHTGVGTTPNYRGLCYVVWNNFDITDFGSTIPMYRFEVQVDGAELITSRVYPLQATDDLAVSIAAPTGTMDTIPFDELEVAAGYGGAYWEQVKYETGPYTDDLEVRAGYAQSYWESVALSTGPYIDDLEVRAGYAGAYWQAALIRQIMVPEKLQIGISAPTGTMTAV